MAQIKELKARAETIRLMLAKMQPMLQELAEIETQIKILEQDGAIRITDHARVRYMERIMKIDIEALDQQILNENATDLISRGFPTFRYGMPTHKIVVENGILKTVLPPK